MAAASYDPGKPTPITPIGENRYSVPSFKTDRCYLVDLNAATCTCEDFRRRGQERPCKHLIATKQQARWLKLLMIAKGLSDADLTRFLQRYTELGDAEVAGALRVEREERRQAKAAAAERDPALEAARRDGRVIDQSEWLRQDAIEAGYPAAPKVWKSVKTFGPTTDAEMYEALR
jgi:hypothetical protein